MKRLSLVSATAPLAMCLAMALATPAVAQPAVTAPAGEAAPASTAAPAQRTVRGRDLMTAEERATFRRELRQATPEQQQQLWQQKRAELAQRAAQRGLVLAEPGSMAGTNGGERAEKRGREGGRGEENGSMMSRWLRWGPRAP